MIDEAKKLFGLNSVGTHRIFIKPDASYHRQVLFIKLTTIDMIVDDIEKKILELNWLLLLLVNNIIYILL